MRHPSIFRPSCAAAATLGILLLTACDEPLSSPEESERISPEGIAASTLSPEEHIDYGDTYYLADVVQQGSTVVNSDVPIVDPVTGVETTEWTVEHDTEYQRVEGGYDAYGNAIQTMVQLG
ncbi:MAG: hypothetical protein LC667_06265 [Thioalkalivibrio sp.]|nr:hypothetical protein [Thioalkalivibrio sp.]